MSSRTAAVVLWFALALILPLPLPAEEIIGWWPLAKWASWAWQGGAVAAGLGVLAWALVLLVVARWYARRAAALPPKWPGALVGLLIWILLVATATLPAFRAPDGTRLTFMELYGPDR